MKAFGWDSVTERLILVYNGIWSYWIKVSFLGNQAWRPRNEGFKIFRILKNGDFNELYDQSTGLFIAFSAVDINNSIFNFNEFPIEYEYNWDTAYDYSLQGWFMSISSGPEVNIDNTSFENGYGSNGGAIYDSGTATLTITDNNFNYGYVMSQGGAIYEFGFNKIVIISCTFNDNYSEGDSSDLYLDSRTTEITNTNFYLLPGPSSIFVLTGNFSVTLLTFSNDYPELNEFYESMF